MFDIKWSRKVKITGFVSFGGASESLDAPRGVPVALPDGFQLDDDGLERRVSWRWFSWYAMRGIIFAAIFSVPFALVLYAYVNSPDKSWPAPALATSLAPSQGSGPCRTETRAASTRTVVRLTR